VFCLISKCKRKEYWRRVQLRLVILRSQAQTSLLCTREIRGKPLHHIQSNFPLNDLLIEEILQRLTNFKSACKNWSSLISTPFARRFTTHHLNHQYKQNPFPFSSVIGLNLEYLSVIIIYVIHFRRNGMLSLCLNPMKTI